MTKSAYIQIETTFSSMTEAESIAKFLVENRLAACAQIVGEIESLYFWRERFETTMEYLLLVKTRAEMFDKIAAEISQRHSYECPQIVAVALENVSTKYAVWLDAQIDFPCE